MQHNAGKLAEAKQGYTKLLEQYKPSAGVYVNYAILHESTPPIHPQSLRQAPACNPESLSARTGRPVGRQYTIRCELSHL